MGRAYSEYNGCIMYKEKIDHWKVVQHLKKISLNWITLLQKIPIIFLFFFQIVNSIADWVLSDPYLVSVYTQYSRSKQSG